MEEQQNKQQASLIMVQIKGIEAEDRAKKLPMVQVKERAAEDI